MRNTIFLKKKKNFEKKFQKHKDQNKKKRKNLLRKYLTKQNIRCENISLFKKYFGKTTKNKNYF